jgi:arsenate reductase-like glutaredoxin family protein
MNLSSNTDKNLEIRDLKKEEIKKALEELDTQFETFMKTSQSTASDAKDDLDKMAERAKKTIQRLE